MLGVCLLILRRYGYGPPPVHYVGKAATFLLLIAFPILLLRGRARYRWVGVSDRVGLCVVGPRPVLARGLFYAVQVAGAVREARRSRVGTA